MNIISLFQSFVNHLSNILENNLFLHELEHNIFNSTNELNLEKYINKFRNQANKLIDSNNKYNIEYHVDNHNFNSKDNCRLDYFLSKRI